MVRNLLLRKKLRSRVFKQKFFPPLGQRRTKPISLVWWIVIIFSLSKLECLFASFWARRWTVWLVELLEILSGQHIKWHSSFHRTKSWLHPCRSHHRLLPSPSIMCILNTLRDRKSLLECLLKSLQERKWPL